MHYTGHLNGHEAILAICGLIGALMVSFWFVPRLPRSLEKEKLAELSCRAFIVFGPSWLKQGGQFYRVSVYEDFLLFVFWGTQKIHYRDIKNLDIQTGKNVTMTVHGVKVKIFGFSGQMRLLYSQLQVRTHC
jgi:hypothetical protein